MGVIEEIQEQPFENTTEYIEALKEGIQCLELEIEKLERENKRLRDSKLLEEHRNSELQKENGELRDSLYTKG